MVVPANWQGGTMMAVLAPAHGVDEELLDTEKWGVHSDLTGACGCFCS